MHRPEGAGSRAERALVPRPRNGIASGPHRDRSRLGRADAGAAPQASDSRRRSQPSLRRAPEPTTRRRDTHSRARGDVLRHQRRASRLTALGTVRGNRPAEPLLLLKADAVRQLRLHAHAVRNVVHANVRAGRLSAGRRSFGENLAWGQGESRLAAAHARARGSTLRLIDANLLHGAGATSGSRFERGRDFGRTASRSG